MKIRTGFVSNSSSSSFVVAFARRPKTVEEMQKMLFGKETAYPAPYDGEIYEASQVAQTVFDDLKRAKKLSADNVAQEIQSGSFDGYPDRSFDSMANNAVADRMADWDRHVQDVRLVAGKIAAKFLTTNKNCKFYVFSYSDNDGAYQSALEHGNLFERLPHIKISHH